MALKIEMIAFRCNCFNGIRKVENMGINSHIACNNPNCKSGWIKAVKSNPFTLAEETSLYKAVNKKPVYVRKKMLT